MTSLSQFSIRLVSAQTTVPILIEFHARTYFAMSLITFFILSRCEHFGVVVNGSKLKNSNCFKIDHNDSNHMLLNCRRKGGQLKSTDCYLPRTFIPNTIGNKIVISQNRQNRFRILFFFLIKCLDLKIV